MKKLHLFFTIFLPLLALAQSQNQNYIKTTAYKKPTLNGTTVNQIGGGNLTVNDKNISVTYFDGLGRPIQKRLHRMAGDGNDLVQHIEYDDFGRGIKQYLPYADVLPTLDFTTNAKTDTETFYDVDEFDNTLNPYSEKQFEASPLSRLVKAAAPGNDWSMSGDHTVRMQYDTNSEADQVRFYTANAIWNDNDKVFEASLATDGYYSKQELYKTVTYDENAAVPLVEINGSTVEFKNKEGQVILNRKYIDSQFVDTYNVYDQFGNLAYVIPPMADDPISQLDGFCYQYRYDNRNRMVQKKEPGAEWQYLVYDKLDRIVASGPANSPFGDSETGWIITKYDRFGRVAYTGWMPEQDIYVSRRVTLTNLISANTSMYEARSASGTIDGFQARYTSDIAPTSGYKLLTVNYYDAYDFVGAPALPITVIDEPATANVRGLGTGSWIRVLSNPVTPEGETHYVLYDKRLRPIRSFVVSYLTGFTQVDNTLNWTGLPVTTITTHKKTAANSELYIKDSFVYNAQQRLSRHFHQFGLNGTPELMSLNKYDRLGRPVEKMTGGQDLTGTNSYQKVDYAYNVRGWLTSMNDIFGMTDDDPADLFSLNLEYNTPRQQVSGVTPLYNGNISESYWRTDADNKVRMYGYQYDVLNRFERATYKKLLDDFEDIAPELNSYDEATSYDKNGNILSLNRTGFLDSDVPGAYYEIDRLVYEYKTNTNLLLKVTDNTNSYDGFRDGLNSDIDYDYDGNGDMIVDRNKNIGSISYNHLHLPVKIGVGQQSDITYLYDATGKKLEKRVNDNGTHTLTYYSEGFQYNGSDLQFFPTSEGYVDIEKGFNHYVYNYLDHLGNIRLSYGKDLQGNLKIIEENHYYPFGLKHMNYNAQKFDYRKEDDGILVNLEPVERNDYQYKYNGKEWQDELGLNMYTMDMRQYDPAIARWVVQDPVVHHQYSPYAAFDNNPVYFADPMGSSALSPFEQRERDENGKAKFDGVGGGTDLHRGIEGQYYAGSSEGGPIDPPKPGEGTNTGNAQGHLPNGAPDNVDSPAEQLDTVVITTRPKGFGTKNGGAAPAYPFPWEVITGGEAAEAAEIATGVSGAVVFTGIGVSACMAADESPNQRKGRDLLYRFMVSDSDGFPTIGNKYGLLGARSRDIDIDSDGMVGGWRMIFDPQGMSINREPTGRPGFVTYALSPKLLPPGLTYKWDGPNHGVIMPVGKMSFTQYTTLLSATRYLWSPVK